MKQFLLSLLAFVFIGSSFAGQVGLQDAKSVAKNAYYQKVITFHQYMQFDELTVENVTELELNGHTAIYAVDFKGLGYILIAANDAIEPVLGYTFTNHYANVPHGDNFLGLIESYKEHVDYLRVNNIEASAGVAAQWDNLQNFAAGSFQPNKSAKDIEPLLTCTWNQDWPYNYYCPEDNQGPGGHVYVGCVATAMSQIMLYWRYPSQGTSSHSYYCPGYGTLSVNYEFATYDWDGMVDNSDSYVNEPMALIGYHAAVSVDMGFGWDGSGAYSDDVPYALETYFSYDDACIYKSRQGVALTTWEGWAQTELEDLCPVYYSGQSSDGGHAFVLDGYQETDGLYHFNFGWSGYDNGWYEITDAGGFTTWQGMVLNIFPEDSDYPYYCTPDYERTSLVGSFEDGSGPQENYEASADCSWLINPQTATDSVEYIKLEFVVLDTETDDIITIYDGETTAAPVLGTYSGSTPPTGYITSTGNKVLVTFQADGDGTTGSGWRVEYSSTKPTYCGGGVTNLTEPIGTISDGSGSFNYNNNSNCMWKIAPAYATDITLSFTEFDLEDGVDLLKIYDATNNQLLAEYTGSEIPEDIYCENGELFLIFTANGAVNANGWTADWEIGNVGTNDRISGVSEMKVYPNPAQDVLSIQFNLEEQLSFDVEMITITGKTVYSERVNDASGSYYNAIDLSNMAKGVYFLNIRSEMGSVNKKVVVR